MRTTTGPLNLLPDSIRSQLEKHRETIKFLMVGGTCFLITNVITYLLKFTIMNAKPVRALVIGTVVATIVSYFLNREWSFNTRGGRRRHTEMLLFVVVNLIGIGINSAPQYISRYALHLDEAHHGLLVQEIADYASGMVLGTALAMIFRLWAFRAWVFPDKLEETTPEMDTNLRVELGELAPVPVSVIAQGQPDGSTAGSLQYSA